jgi:hypothetical protein
MKDSFRTDTPEQTCGGKFLKIHLNKYSQYILI